MRFAICDLVIFVIVAQASAATTSPASMPTSQPIPRQTMQQMYRRELGPLYRAADSQKYFRASELIEQYFDSPEQRKSVVTSLQTVGLDPNVIGRLTRIRTNWPDLEPGVYYINERWGPHDVRYFLGIPKNYDRATPWPLVLKLPAADAFVNDPKPDPVQVSQIYTDWMSDELNRHPDAVVVMPLLNLDELWGPSYIGMNNVIQPMLHVANRVNIDPARVYLVGHSMSAHAVWNFGLHYPTYFASFEALAGGVGADWQRLRMMNLRNILPVVWHDADDTLIKVDIPRQLVKVLRQNIKSDVDYVETKGVGHVPTQAIADERYAKMRSRVRALYPQRVSIQSNRPDTMFNRSDWVQIYQPLSTGQERKLFFSHGTGHMVVYDGSFNVDATIENNRINATSSNVESVRFYLNDQMVDFSRPVSVSLNRRVRFEGSVKPDIEAMLKDQLFLGRGWRYFTGFVDIDFGADKPGPTTSAHPATRP